ncbi:MAG TPA: hypothetical protein VH440_00230 [Candidatus Limnocylindrales bacterium]
MRLLIAILIGIIAAGCAAPPTAPPSVPKSMSPDAAAIVAAAERLTSIGGPWEVREVSKGRYVDLWRGSSNDMTGADQAGPDVKAGLVVWRVDLAGPNGIEELYIDSADGQLVDAITQGR